MKNTFFKTIQSTTFTAPLALFAVCYTNAILHSYHESKKHEEKMKNYYEKQNITPVESTIWSRFKNAYLPLFPLIPENKTPYCVWPRQENHKRG